MFAPKIAKSEPNAGQPRRQIRAITAMPGNQAQLRQRERQRQSTSSVTVMAQVAPGQPLDTASRAFFEPRFNTDLRHIRIHTGNRAEANAQAFGARAFTQDQDIAFGRGEYQPNTQAGRSLLAHELAHALSSNDHVIRRQPAPQSPVTPAASTPATAAPVTAQPAAADPLSAPLTDAEWHGVGLWLARGVIGVDKLTSDSDHNADLIAGAVFCGRFVGSPGWGKGDPLLCVLADVTATDPRVKALKPEVLKHGPLINWTAVPRNDRIVHVMDRLVDVHHLSVNGAAGIVGNLFAESGVLPNRIEGSSETDPMHAANMSGKPTDFAPDDVRDRSSRAKDSSPDKPGIGLAQWTSEPRRANLFQQTTPDGQALGSSTLFNMDAQVDYLVSELAGHTGLATGSLADVSDNIVYNFEIPGAILGPDGKKLPRTDPAVQAVFATRRGLGQTSLAAYQDAHKAP